MKAKRPNKAKPAESGWTTLSGYIRTFLDIIITIYLVLIIVVMPFYFQEGYNHIGSDKSYFFRNYTAMAARAFLPVLAAYLLCRFADLVGTYRGKGLRECLCRGIRSISFSITDLFALGYALSVILSYVCTKYKDTALWGTSGWYMGTIPQLMLVGIYFAVSRFWKKKNWLVSLFFPVSAAVFALGYLNRFDLWPIPMENSGLPNFISTIGNINWYCGYMVSVLFLGVGLFWSEESGKKWKAFLLALYCFVGFATAVTQGSDSGVFTLAVIFWIMFVLSARRGRECPRRILRFWMIELLLAGACVMTLVLVRKFPERFNYKPRLTDLLINRKLLICLTILGISALCLAYLQIKSVKCNNVAATCYRVLGRAACIIVPVAAAALVILIVINTKRPGSLGGLSDNAIFTFNEKWGSNRGLTWMTGWQCFRDQDFLHKLVGVGNDCMADHIYLGGNGILLERVRNAFGNARLTNAHGEWLTILINSGLLGAVSFAGIMVSSVIRLIGSGPKNPLAFACGLCVLAYTCNNIWSFQQSMSVATIFVIMGIGENCLYSGNKHGIMT